MVQGLTSAAGQPFNGKEAVVQGYDSEQQRYAVNFPDGTINKLKAQNLVPVAGYEAAGQLATATTAATAAVRFGTAASGGSDGRGNPGDAGPEGWTSGTRVRIHGLMSEAAKVFNLQYATVSGYDSKQQRYAVAFNDGNVAFLKARNLEPFTGDKPKNTKTLGELNWVEGTRVKLQGLTQLPEFNGVCGVLDMYEAQTQRYVVILPGGAEKKFQASNLQFEEAPRPDGPRYWRSGTKVKTHGVTGSGPYGQEGQEVTVQRYDMFEQRYIVVLPDGSTQKMKPGNLEAVPEEKFQAIGDAPSINERTQPSYPQATVAAATPATASTAPPPAFTATSVVPPSAVPPQASRPGSKQFLVESRERSAGTRPATMVNRPPTSMNFGLPELPEDIPYRDAGHEENVISAVWLNWRTLQACPDRGEAAVLKNRQAVLGAVRGSNGEAGGRVSTSGQSTS
jgi:hypothetical protein